MRWFHMLDAGHHLAFGLTIALLSALATTSMAINLTRRGFPTWVPQLPHRFWGSDIDSKIGHLMYFTCTCVDQ